MGTNSKVEAPILFFDGVCNLCDSSIQFVIKRDKQDTFRFASLQSQKAKDSLPGNLTEEDNFQSLVLLQDGVIHTKSTAALLVAKKLSGLWPLLAVFLVLPKFFRDYIYDFIARNRYRWFGKKDQCMIPTPELRFKFID